MVHLITNKTYRQYKSQDEEAQRLRDGLRSAREELEYVRLEKDRAKNDSARLEKDAAVRGVEDNQLIRGLRRDLERLQTAIAALTEGDFHEAEPQENTDRVLRRLIDHAPQLGLDGAWLQRMTGVPTPPPARVTLLLCYGGVVAAYPNVDSAQADVERQGEYPAPARTPRSVQLLDLGMPWLLLEMPVFGSVEGGGFTRPGQLAVLTSTSRGEVPEAYATTSAAEEDLLGRDPSWRLEHIPVFSGDRHETYASRPATTAGSESPDRVPF